MQDQEWQPQLIRSSQLGFQGQTRSLKGHGVCSAKIDQITGVTEDNRWPIRRFCECVQLRPCQVLGEPLHVVLHENLDRGTTHGMTSFQSFGWSTRDGHVSAEERRSLGWW